MNARDIALLMLDQVDLPDWPRFSAPAEARRQRPDASHKDLELGGRIFQEIPRNLLLINHLIEQYANRPITKIDALVRKILGVALVQILFLDRIPRSAAVNEAVEQTKRFRKKSASGFVNALLRRAIRQPSPELPKVEDNPREYARLALSHPPELFDRLVKLFGTEDALAFCRHDNRRPPTILRLMPGVPMEQLIAPEVTLLPHERRGMVVMQPTIAPLIGEWAMRGLAQPQDPTAAAVADDCDIQPGQNVLDRCCGLGTKTMQLRERLGETGSLVAIDPAPLRIDGLRLLVQERGLSNLHPILGSKVRDAEPWVADEGFDRVLIDVPCSNSGVLARRGVARYFQTDATLASLYKTQWDILTDTAPAIRSGGLIIYSTCSVWPEENEQIVRQFLESNSALTLEHERTTLPSFKTEDPTRYHDGGYVAVLRKG